MLDTPQLIAINSESTANQLRINRKSTQNQLGQIGYNAYTARHRGILGGNYGAGGTHTHPVSIRF